MMDEAEPKGLSLGGVPPLSPEQIERALSRHALTQEIEFALDLFEAVRTLLGRGPRRRPDNPAYRDAREAMERAESAIALAVKIAAAVRPTGHDVKAFREDLDSARISLLQSMFRLGTANGRLTEGRRRSTNGRIRNEETLARRTALDRAIEAAATAPGSASRHAKRLEVEFSLSQQHLANLIQKSRRGGGVA